MVSDNSEDRRLEFLSGELSISKLISEFFRGWSLSGLICAILLDVNNTWEEVLTSTVTQIIKIISFAKFSRHLSVCFQALTCP